MRAPCAHVSKRTTGALRNKGVLPCGLRASRMRVCHVRLDLRTNALYNTSFLLANAAWASSSPRLTVRHWTTSPQDVLTPMTKPLPPASPASPARRVVVTGFGLISPLGNTPEQFWQALASGHSGVDTLRSIPTDNLPFSWGGEARDFTGHIDDFGPLDKQQKRAIRKGVKVMCREIQMAVAAAQRALHAADLHSGDYVPERTGVVFGSDYIMTAPDEFIDGVRSCMDAVGRFEFDRWAADGLPKVTPLWLLKYLPNMPASHIAIYNDLRGPSNSLTVREASANLAISEARHLIARGAADTIVAGATGTRIHPLRTVHVVTQEPVATAGSDPRRVSRPFDRDRSGMVLAEGAGAIVLESLERAQQRGATIWAEVIGSGSSAVARPDGTGDWHTAITHALRHALARAAVTPAQVGHVHAHGLSAPAMDAAEAQAIADVFRDRPTPVPVTAAKSYYGNPGAACGVLELIASILAIDKKQLFPVLNYVTPDPDCPIEVNRTLATDPGTVAVSVNVTPQGQASAIVVRKPAA